MVGGERRRLCHLRGYCGRVCFVRPLVALAMKPSPDYVAHAYECSYLYVIPQPRRQWTRRQRIRARRLFSRKMRKWAMPPRPPRRFLAAEWQGERGLTAILGTLPASARPAKYPIIFKRA